MYKAIYEKHTEKQFRNKITYFSFVLSFFVIGIHTYNVSTYGLQEREDFLSRAIVLMENFIKNISDICVPFFFLISGYLFFRTFSWNRIWVKYKSRFFSILVPYLLWCCIYYLYYIVISRIPGVREYINNGVPIEFSVSTWIDWLWNQSYYTLWFLKELILLIAATPIIYLLMKNYKYFPCGGIMLLLTFLLTLDIVKINIYTFNIYYILGAYIGINCKDIPLLKNTKITVVSRITIVCILLWYLRNVQNEIGKNTVAVIILCIAFWWAFDGISYGKTPKWWMEISFFIYCMHDILLEGFEKIFFLIFGNRSIYALLDYIFMPFIVLVMCIFCAAILRNYFPYIWKILTGGRAETKK